ncbi:hypothetical protein JDV02_004836 [Purpureocillium takamizusanense]|uniref:Uncharacterized protein n=1 Tax=Purpureocillium takamizusanense TaxID=2060973 RepID=A0A9Q8QEP2_9HYPO|nr:uncharacterized protein JDV02_004836 [Purpureocillium takamizusanense]UNI18578.1 hypothetical protein JDV02_004836 [Purpureocillium takamizusanense]
MVARSFKSQSVDYWSVRAVRASHGVTLGPPRWRGVIFPAPENHRRRRRASAAQQRLVHLLTLFVRCATTTTPMLPSPSPQLSKRPPAMKPSLATGHKARSTGGLGRETGLDATPDGQSFFFCTVNANL